MRYILRHDEVLATYPSDAWQNAAAVDAFDHLMSNGGRSFPCPFAVRAAVEGGLHYAFAEDGDGSNIATALTEFLRNAHDIGPYATLSYVFPPEDVQSMEDYRRRFWDALMRLRAADQQPWPDDIPYSLTDPDWTFCFDGDAVFPLCLTPAHRKKRTRYARNFSISFQPRWTFKHHLPNAEIMQKYSKTIRNKIGLFDDSPISPYLGLYGHGALDAEKYFFHDENLPAPFPNALDYQS